MTDSADNHLKTIRSLKAIGSLRVMVVDDERTTLSVMGVYLREIGFEPILISDPTTVARIAEEEQPDLLLIDIHMPGIGGFDLTAAIAAGEMGLNSQLPVIAMSSSDHRDEALAAGAAEFYRKPVVAERFFDLLATVLL